MDELGYLEDELKFVDILPHGDGQAVFIKAAPELINQLEHITSIHRHDPENPSGRPYRLSDGSEVVVEFAKNKSDYLARKSADNSQADHLTTPSQAEQQEVMNRWQQTVSGMDGERITRLDKPDDPVAYKLLDAAGEAIGRGQVQAGINILQLVVKDFGASQEAALARQALDQIKKQAQRSR